MSSTSIDLVINDLIYDELLRGWLVLLFVRLFFLAGVLGVGYVGNPVSGDRPSHIRSFAKFLLLFRPR